MDPISPFAPQSATSQTRNASALSSDFDTFLLMLTTQLENQDPLAPMDSQELSVQLATFSGVEQQTLTNELLEDLASQISASGLAQMGDWIGRMVLAEGAIRFDGAPVEVALAIPSHASHAELVLARPNGTEVQRIPIAPTTTAYTWTGMQADGTSAAPGSYVLAVEAWSDGTPLNGASAASYHEVIEVRTTPSGLQLVTPGGDVIPASTVQSLRR